MVNILGHCTMQVKILLFPNSSTCFQVALHLDRLFAITDRYPITAQRSQYVRRCERQTRDCARAQERFWCNRKVEGTRCCRTGTLTHGNVWITMLTLMAAKRGLWCGNRASSSAGQAHPLREPRGSTSSRSLERKVADHHRFVLRSNFSGSTKKRLSPQRASARKYQYRLREFPTPRKYLKIGAPEESRVATRRRRRMARASRRCCGFPSRLPKAALDAECTKHTSASSHKVRWDICAAAMLPRAHGPVLAT